MRNITFAVFVIVNILAAVALHAAGIDRHNPSTVDVTKMFWGSFFASSVLFVVLAKTTGRKPFWER